MNKCTQIKMSMQQKSSEQFQCSSSFIGMKRKCFYFSDSWANLNDWLADWSTAWIILLTKCILVTHANIIYFCIVLRCSFDGYQGRQCGKITGNGLCFRKHPQAKWIFKLPNNTFPFTFWNLWRIWIYMRMFLLWFSDSTKIILKFHSELFLHFYCFHFNSEFNRIETISHGTHFILNCLEKHHFDSGEPNVSSLKTFIVLDKEKTETYY